MDEESVDDRSSKTWADAWRQRTKRDKEAQKDLRKRSWEQREQARGGRNGGRKGGRKGGGGRTELEGRGKELNRRQGKVKAEWDEFIRLREEMHMVCERGGSTEC